LEIVIINLICFVVGLWIGKLTRQVIIKKPVPMPYYVEKNKTPEKVNVDAGIKKEEEIIFIRTDVPQFTAPETGNFVITTTATNGPATYQEMQEYLWRQTELAIEQEVAKRQNKTKTPKKPKKNLPPKPVKRKPNIGNIDLSSL